MHNVIATKHSAHGMANSGIFQSTIANMQSHLSLRKPLNTFDIPWEFLYTVKKKIRTYRGPQISVLWNIACWACCVIYKCDNLAYIGLCLAQSHLLEKQYNHSAVI